MRNQTSSTYEDDNGTIWIRTGESATFTFGNNVFVFGQNVDKEGNQTLFSNIFSVFSEVEQKGEHFSPNVLKGALAIGATTSLADGPLPIGEAVGAVLVVGATLYTAVDYGIYFFSKKARGNYRDDGLRDMDDQAIADALAGLTGKLTAEQKRLKERLTTEQKIRKDRNNKKSK